MKKNILLLLTMTTSVAIFSAEKPAASSRPSSPIHAAQAISSPVHRPFTAGEQEQLKSLLDKAIELDWNNNAEHTADFITFIKEEIPLQLKLLRTYP